MTLDSMNTNYIEHNLFALLFLIIPGFISFCAMACSLSAVENSELPVHFIIDLELPDVFLFVLLRNRDITMHSTLESHACVVIHFGKITRRINWYHFITLVVFFFKALKTSEIYEQMIIYIQSSTLLCRCS